MFGLHHIGAFGGIGHLAVGLPPVRQVDVAQLALERDVANEKRHAGAGMQERALAQQPRADRARDLDLALFQLRHRGGHQHMRQHRQHQGHDHAEHQHRSRQPPRAVAGRLHHGQFGIAHQPVSDIDSRRKGRHRQHQRDHARQAQRGEFKEHPRRMAIRNQPVEQHHGAVHPVDGDQHKREEPKEDHELRQHVPVESWHDAPLIRHGVGQKDPIL